MNFGAFSVTLKENQWSRLQSQVMSDLGLVLAEVWQGERRLWVDGVMVDVSLGRHKDQLTASAGWKDGKVWEKKKSGAGT